MEPNRISAEKKLSNAERIRFFDFIKNSCGYSSEEGLTGYRYNFCLINYEIWDSRLTLDIKGPLNLSKETLEGLDVEPYKKLPKETLEAIFDSIKKGN